MTRLGVNNVEPLVLDGMLAHGELPPASFDRALIDAPCSNTGVIRRRVDVRWRPHRRGFSFGMPEQTARHYCAASCRWCDPAARSFTALAAWSSRKTSASWNARSPKSPA
jgi:16S rRNA C967 or C1407 C5-methylase (RsmB/RsmF family)